MPVRSVVMSMLSSFALLAASSPASARPARHLLSVDAWPLRARVELRDASGRVLSGRAPFRRVVAAGPVRVTATLDGHRSFKRTVIVGRAAHVTACLDPDDQLVRCRHILRTGWVPKSVALSADGRQAWVALLGTRPGVEVFDVIAGR
ncbi:MAG: hypothetical protein KC503_04750, partial [Myxococcales bacterium]|nr:hypothetical protein [Myxococcales bacterium]